MQPSAIALEHRLKQCNNVITLGVRPNFCDYSDKEQELILGAPIIYYPSMYYAELFDTIGKQTFPSYHTYKFTQDKIKQTTLFQLLKVPHPMTRFFYGKRQQAKIFRYFSFPFIAKIPRGSALGKGVYLIRSEEELEKYLNLTHVAYIQEFLKTDRDIRVVVMGGEIVHAYWRIAAPGEFRTNVAQGAVICFDPVPKEALDLAIKIARMCRFDDVGLDICFAAGQYWVIEANMKYGKEGFNQAGIDYYQMMFDMIEKKKLLEISRGYAA